MRVAVRKASSQIELDKALDSQSRVPCSKPLCGSKVDPAFHPFEVDQMSTGNFWELSGKK